MIPSAYEHTVYAQHLATELPKRAQLLEDALALPATSAGHLSEGPLRQCLQRRTADITWIRWR